MTPDKALGLCFAGAERCVAKVSMQKCGAVLRRKGGHTAVSAARYGKVQFLTRIPKIDGELWGGKVPA